MAKNQGKNRIYIVQLNGDSEINREQIGEITYPESKNYTEAIIEIFPKDVGEAIYELKTSREKFLKINLMTFTTEQ